MYKYFNNPQDLQELRKQYTALLKKYHPDNGGSNEEAAEINAEYEKLFEALKNADRENRTTDAKHFESKYNWKNDKALREAIQKIIHLDVTIEICGSWVWVSGNTFDVKDILKTSGYKYSKNKKMWYFTTDSFRYGKKALKMDDIRRKYGSYIVDTEKQERLEA